MDPDTGKQRLWFFSLQKVEHATPTGVPASIKNAFEDHNVDSLKEHIVGLGAGGAAVSLGMRRGIATLMKNDKGIGQLITVHCVSHQLELSIADALKRTAFSHIMYCLYKNSSKKMRQLAGIGAALKMGVSATVKASGTCWLEHKIWAMS